MATPLDIPRPASRRGAALRRIALAAAGVVGILASAVPAHAAPATSGEAAALVAARGHDLEAITEQYNEAREKLAAQRATAEAAIASVQQTTDALAGAQEQVRG